MSARTLRELMTHQVITCLAEDNLLSAHTLMRQHGFRHIPVVDRHGKYLGVVTQKDVLREAFLIVEKYGSSALSEREEKTLLRDVMSQDIAAVDPAMGLAEAGAFFIEKKHGCLPVVENGKLAGIVTSADFVKLCVAFLRAG
ncbi:MAG: CBS domain-containing protein [Oceanospirillaceae bacterium]|nr:CBS domain-containing protein [Oceanospirillaceae bacterium]MCP5349574.1 CBS domain-containing protein [Oceanospirillaceae bacterium]